MGFKINTQESVASSIQITNTPLKKNQENNTNHHHLKSYLEVDTTKAVKDCTNKT